MSQYCYDTKDIKIIDFGEVEMGRTIIKSIKIMNESCKEQFYEAQRDPVTNPIDHVFNLKSYTWTLLPEQSFSCEVQYRPVVPCSKNVDYFIITGTVSTYIKIIACGTCIGPKISSSANKIILKCSKKYTQVKKQIKLSNHSKVKAIFAFDIDIEQRHFKLDIRQGILNPDDYKYITITFIPTEEGIYVYHLPCLILYQSPIIIKLFGFCTSIHQQSEINLDSDKFSSQEQNGFEEYMSDSINIKKGNLELISLSKNYFDCSQVDTKNKINRTHQTVCFTNHNKTNLLLKWDQDVTGVFKIEPRIAKICPNHSALFEIIFQPNEENNLYTKQFIGYFFDKDPRDEGKEENKIFVIPSFTCIRVIGHSFPTNSAGWIPQYELPSMIVLPPCIPSLSVYTTFVIKKFGHLPLMFHFLPPADSHFVVKPMLGIIYEDYQIVVVQMCPKMIGEHLYMEQWAICFNGNLKNKDYISFKGYTEYANISFNNNPITFVTTHLDTQQKEQILIRNLTRHIIMYEFLNVPSQLIIPHLKGQIYANDIHSYEWVFHPTECGEYNFDIKCILTIIQNDLPVGAEISIILHVTGKCEAGLLVAIPNKLNFDVQLYGNTKTKSFYLYNFSSVNIPFKIICCHKSWPIGCIERDVKIYPLSETVLSRKSKKIVVSLTPYTSGFYEIVIKYIVKINSSTDNISYIQLPRKICNVYCMCELPTLKIEDVQFYGICSSISKINLWKIIEFPPMLLHENTIRIKLHISNPTSVNTKWDIKRIQLCFCKRISKSRGLSFRYMEFDCVHRKVCSIYPQSGLVKPKEIITLNIELRYLLLGKTQVKWDLNIGHERHIFLYMQVEALSGSEEELYLLYPQVVKLDTYFANKKAQHQIYWIYNYTNNYLPYTVDITDLHKINQIYHSEIFACLNPDGIAEPQSLTPLILKYHLKQFTAIEAYLPITFGNKKTKLFISSQPSIVYPPKVIREILPNFDDDEINELPIYFSVDYIHLCTSIHSRVVKIFVMYNATKYDIFSYTWENNNVSELWNIEVHPKKGVIQPRKHQSFRIIINTKSLTCQVNINVICEFINISQRRIFQRNIYKYNEICKQLESEFIFTEKGEHFPKLPSKPEGKPDIFCKALSIQCNIYSPEDILLRTKLMEELKMTPTDELQIEDNIKSSNNYGHTKMILFILEGMIWDILNSRIFKHTIQEYALNGPHLYYSHFFTNPLESEKLIMKSYIAPPQKLIATILEKMLFFIIHEEFHLETEHLCMQKDIRHLNDTKLIPVLQANDKIEDDFHDILRNRLKQFRVSFMD
ncbi:cilia- and flagella-associated protein 65-like [Vespa mandarinia]|uniref:cilia- and flagella-associated protein 65-like n=1 Tax=Vespa mandarinia TaxID=7446 RepID=UPI001621FB1B|nr:cilia- and flagella-associated protein 65-like [Vespa mandarinia]